MNSVSISNTAKAVKLITVIKSITVIFLVFSSVNLFAQASVRDSSPIVPSASPGVQSNQQGEFSSFNQLQLLKQEVLELRGLVEEQSFELRRLKQQRLDDYLDLDKRITALSQGVSIGSNNLTGSKPVQPKLEAPSILSGSPIPSVVRPASVNNAEQEKDLYRKAIDQLLDQKDYKAAQSSFKDYLNRYPSGVYVPNIYYWQGQIYFTENNKASAQDAFSKLISDHPDHSKVPDAKYKLATILFDQGNKSQARNLLDEVASGSSNASRLAKAFLANQYE